MNPQSLIAEYADEADARVGLEVLSKFGFEPESLALVTGEDRGPLATISEGTGAIDVSRYEQMVDQGSVLVVVTSTEARINEAERGLKTTSLKAIHRVRRPV